MICLSGFVKTGQRDDSAWEMKLKFQVLIIPAIL